MGQIHSVIEFQQLLEWYTPYSEKYFSGQGTLYPTISGLFNYEIDKESGN